ncbi:glycerol-3-phosphate dehydrogenase/oxidase [Paenibacillus sp. KQZ6P-2]|uniref:Glycerol-3-phosphate dehydrogenase n=1 Tax=Paenibacillus mangrovi TaxID=2931978 RepID=A0A9X1WSU6_9BACL|nr:FAD-dependent oxidoreductase [Paenibacillus mangrovi]MCJ8014378.1 glycerol-3-phosphate dehydrogenase/oxidase [Paenibacillus mangrovi]
MTFTNTEREQIMNTLRGETFDVLVIGGGITGAGIALDAATRGMKTALVEMQDFAAGTSSRSTKLVHGGLRYLKQFEVGMVAEVGKERAIVYENGPHVTTPEWMLLPMHKGGTFGKFSTSIGLRVYDFLAGVKKGERRSMLSVGQTLDKEPLIKKDGLKGGGYYVEYRTDDARLTIEVMKAAVEHGATALNYSKVESLIYDDKKQVKGAVVRDLLTGDSYKIKAAKVVNSTGPWVGQIREMDASNKGKTLRLTKGVHLVIDQSRFPLRQAVYFDTPDKRMVFAIPRDGKTYVGTTDTFYEEDPVHPQMTASDRSYIVKAINFMFPEVKMTEQDIESSWAGVRPLIYEEGKDPSEISRKDEIWESDSGLLTIAGGKLTGYRKMAETIVDVLAHKLGETQHRTFKPCQTKHLPISGGDMGGSKSFDAFVQKTAPAGVQAGLSQEEAVRIARMYGTNTPKVYQRIAAGKDKANSFGMPLMVYGQLAYALDEEMVASPVDFLTRRTGATLFNIDLARKMKEPVIQMMASYLGWTAQAQTHYMSEMEKALADAVIPIPD